MRKVFNAVILVVVTMVVGGGLCVFLLGGNGERVLETKADGGVIVIKAKNKKLNYYLLMPSQKTLHGEKLPMLLIFHGRGESGIDYVTAFKKDIADNRLIVVASDWEQSFLRGKSRYEDFYLLVDHVAKKYSANRQNVFIMGVSAGSLLTRALVTNNPMRWAGVILVASDSYVGWAYKIDATQFPPMLFVHGEHDEQFDYEALVKSIEVLNKKGFDVELFSDSGARHEYKAEWDQVILRWLKKEIKN